MIKTLTRWSDGLCGSHSVWLWKARLLWTLSAHCWLRQSGFPLLLQLFLDLINLLSQKVVILILNTKTRVTSLSNPRITAIKDIWNRLCLLPCCLQTHTCPLQPYGRKRPGYPSVCPSVLQGLVWGIWLELCVVFWRECENCSKTTLFIKKDVLLCDSQLVH